MSSPPSLSFTFLISLKILKELVIIIPWFPNYIVFQHHNINPPLNCSNLARIERSAQKQAKSGTENAGWYENW